MDMTPPDVDSRTDRLLRTLRLRHLELLVVLSATPTMRSAAARLHLSQPAISKMLGELEACFGAKLFERSQRGISSNPLGAAAAFRARAVLNELSRATSDVDAMQRGATAVLRVGAPSVTATIPAAIVALRARLPGIAVQLKEGRVHELIHLLLDRELDCVFGAITPQLMASDMIPLLEPAVLLEDELCVLASTSASALIAHPLRWRDLKDAQWVLPPKETLVRQAFDAAFLGVGAPPPRAGRRGLVVGHDRYAPPRGFVASLRGPARACNGRDCQGRSAKAESSSARCAAVIRPVLPARCNRAVSHPHGISRRHKSR